MIESSAPLMEAALRAHRAGLRVLPPREDGSKAPREGEWKAAQSEPATEAEVRAYYANGRTGLGIVCGSISGGLELLEFDDEAAWHEFQARAEDAGLSYLLARVEDGYLERTPGGGVHLLYRCEAPRTTKLARRPKRAEEKRDPHDKVKTLAETKGEGGFVIVAPSCGRVHPTGRPYELLSGGFESIVHLTAEERSALHTLARTLDELAKPVVPGAPSLSQRTETRSGSDLRPGDDYNARGSWAELLEPHGWRRLFGRGDEWYWCRPGKAEGISATTNFRGSELLYVFSTSTLFESERSYDLFGAYAVLEHGGDLAAAGRALAAQGYGTRSANSVGRAAEHGEPAGASVYDEPIGPAGVSVSASPPLRGVAMPDGGTSDAGPPWPSPLDPAAMLGLAGDFVALVEPHTESDPAALLLQFLAMAGNVLGRGAHFKAEADAHYPNLFVALVGESSKARKGTSFGQVKAALGAVDPRWAGERIASGLSSGEGLVWQVRDAITKREPIREKGRVVGYQDVEADPGIEDKRLLVFEAELASTLRTMTRDGNTLSALLRTAWDTGTLQFLTKNQQARATGAHVTIVGHITRDELRRYLDRTEAGNGFANRFLWVCVRRSKLLPEGGQLASVDFAPFLRELDHALGAVRKWELQRDAAARALWCDVYPELSEGRPGLIGAVTSRAEAQVMRLALIYAALDADRAIRAPHLEAALAVWQYAAASARHIFGDALGDPKADEALGLIRGAPGITRAALGARLFSKHGFATQLDRILRLLHEHGLARPIREPTGGRPVERWLPGDAGKAG